MLARERLLGAPFAFPHGGAAREGLLEPFETLADRREGDAETAAFRFIPGGPDAEPGAAAGKHVERGHRLRQDARIATDGAGHHRAELGARGDRGHVAERAVALEHVVMFGAVHADLPEVIHHPDGLETSLVGGGCDGFDGVAKLGRPRRQGEVRDAQSDLHAVPPKNGVIPIMPARSMKPVLCVRNDQDDTPGVAVATLADKGVPVTRLDAFAPGIRWPGVDEIGGLIVFGGEMNVDEVVRYPSLLNQRQLIRRAVDGGLPVLGICLGAQILARALDARVYRAPVRELGFKPVRVTDAGQKDALIGAFQTGDRVFQWHEDTFELPAGAELLATSDDVPVQAFRMGPKAWGVQFHFEVDADGVNAWLRAAEPSLERVWKRSAEEVRDELRIYLEAQQQRSRGLLAAFAEKVRSGHTPPPESHPHPPPASERGREG